MSSQEKRQNPYEIELPQSIIDSFARFLVPEIQKFYASEEGRKELEAWEQKFSDKSEEWSKVLLKIKIVLPHFGSALFLSQFILARF